MMNGKDEQRELVQEALNRWWGPLMQFHGNPIPAEDDPMYVWRIKSQGNGEARQQFLDGYVPQIWELGLTVPDPEAAQGRRRCLGVHRAGLGRAQARRHRPRPDDPGAAGAAQSRAGGDGVGAPHGHSPKRRDRLRGLPSGAEGPTLRSCRGVAAPDASFAEAYARAVRPARRVGCALGGPRESVLQIEEFVDELQRNYHRVDGYPLKEKLKRGT